MAHGELKTPGCYHGGRFFDHVGVRFDNLDRRSGIVNADVLDAWFPSAPEVLALVGESLEYLLRTSPPTGCEGLIATVAEVRHLPAECVAVGAGSSDLIYRAFLSWLTPQSRVLLPDPTYGEYRHVLENVIGCRPERLVLHESDGWRIDVDDLAQRLSSDRYELVVLVNPNNPTGVLLTRTDLRRIAEASAIGTRIWIDEAYIDYAGGLETMELAAATEANIFVCKSLSKAYALSGARAAYLVGNPGDVAHMRRQTPPWAVSLPAQVAAVHALGNRAYYEARWAETHCLRNELKASIENSFEVRDTCGNWLLCQAPSAASVVAACEQERVFVRDLTELSDQFRGRTFRVAVKSRVDNMRIAASLGRASLR